jgi:hypothetical protein
MIPRYEPDLLTREDVRVNRRTGFVEAKKFGGYVVGLVSSPGTNVAGQRIWRAHALDTEAFAFSRGAAVQKVLDLWNMHEKAHAYELLTRQSA